MLIMTLVVLLGMTVRRLNGMVLNRGAVIGIISVSSVPACMMMMGWRMMLVMTIGQIEIASVTSMKIGRG